MTVNFLTRYIERELIRPLPPKRWRGLLLTFFIRSDGGQVLQILAGIIDFLEVVNTILRQVNKETHSIK